MIIKIIQEESLHLHLYSELKPMSERIANLLSSPEILEKLMEERGFLLSSIYENRMAVIESLSIENARLREQIQKLQKNNTMTNEIPRRNRLDFNLPAELAIRNAVNEVERLGSDPLLTNCVVILQQAFDLLADYCDSLIAKNGGGIKGGVYNGDAPEDWANSNSAWNTI